MTRWSREDHSAPCSTVRITVFTTPSAMPPRLRSLPGFTRPRRTAPLAELQKMKDGLDTDSIESKLRLVRW